MAHLQSFYCLCIQNETNGAFLGGIYLGIHLCLSLSFLCGPVMYCNPSSAVGYRKALHLHDSGQDWRVLWLAYSPAAGQYFQRLCDCSASLEICLHFPCHPSHPKRRTLRCLSSPVSHNVYPPICIQPLGKLFTKELLFAHHKWHPEYFISSLFLDTTNYCCLSVAFYPFEWERDQPVFPPHYSLRNVS